MSQREVVVALAKECAYVGEAGTLATVAVAASIDVYAELDQLGGDPPGPCPGCASLGGAGWLNASEDSIDEHLLQFRNVVRSIECAVVHDASTKPMARLAEGHIAVWEVVREYRKLGSVEELQSAFPSLDQAELAAALRYAQEHSEEIQALIDEYESVLAKRRAEYPFAR